MDASANKQLSTSSVSHNDKYEMEKAAGVRRADGSLNLKTLKPIHHKLIELHIQGEKNSAISRRLNKTEATISRWLSDPLIISALDDIYKAQDARFKALYGNVIDVIQDGLNKDKHDIGTNLKAADKWLRAHKKFEPDRSQDQNKTAEDIIQQVFSQMNITGDNVQVNLGQVPKEGD